MKTKLLGIVNHIVSGETHRIVGEVSFISEQEFAHYKENEEVHELALLNQAMIYQDGMAEITDPELELTGEYLAIKNGGVGTFFLLPKGISKVHVRNYGRQWEEWLNVESTALIYGMQIIGYNYACWQFNEHEDKTAYSHLAADLFYGIKKFAYDLIENISDETKRQTQFRELFELID